jgi:hypothetical protein
VRHIGDAVDSDDDLDLIPNTNENMPPDTAPVMAADLHAVSSTFSLTYAAVDAPHQRQSAVAFYPITREPTSTGQFRKSVFCLSA